MKSIMMGLLLLGIIVLITIKNQAGKIWEKRHQQSKISFLGSKSIFWKRIWPRSGIQKYGTGAFFIMHPRPDIVISRRPAVS
jgi:hypothetical protein